MIVGTEYCYMLSLVCNPRPPHRFSLGTSSEGLVPRLHRLYCSSLVAGWRTVGRCRLYDTGFDTLEVMLKSVNSRQAFLACLAIIKSSVYFSSYATTSS